MPTDDLRRFAALFERLVAPHRDDEADPDIQSARRLLAHTFHNYIEVAGQGGADSVSNALPWVRVYREMSDGTPPPGKVLALLDKFEALNALDEAFVSRRLAGSGPTAIKRSPAETSEKRVELDTLVELADIERRLSRLASEGAERRSSSLLLDSMLLAATVELFAREARTDVTRTVEVEPPGDEIVPEWRSGGHPTPDEPLWVLTALEQGIAAVNPLKGMEVGLPVAEDSFERGLARKFDELGISPAVRLALSIDPDDGRPRRSVLDAFVGVGPFEEAPALLPLTGALSRVRGRCLDVVRGRSKVEALRPWIEYMRRTCAGLATSRGVSLREATGYAHYALHLMNICDLAAHQPGESTRGMRGRLHDLAEHLRTGKAHDIRHVG